MNATGKIGWGMLVSGALIAMIVAILLFAKYGFSDGPIRLTLVAISGVVSLLAVLMIMAIAFANFNLSDSKQALGLPEGTVRAVIALSLIVIFAIIVVFSFGYFQPEPKLLGNFTKADFESFVNHLPKDQNVSITLKNPEEPDPAKAIFTIGWPLEKSKASEDFAKQVLTTLGTLIAAIAAFYFGTRAAASARDTPEQPTLRILSPTSPTKLAKQKGTELSIKIAVTPEDQAITWEKPIGDDDGILAQVRPGEFTYTRGTHPGDMVSLKFRLVSDPEVTAELNVEPSVP